MLELSVVLGAFLSGASFLLFIGIVFYTILRGKRITETTGATSADTLEWTLPNPPPAHTFETLPVIKDTPGALNPRWASTHQTGPSR